MKIENIRAAKNVPGNFLAEIDGVTRQFSLRGDGDIVAEIEAVIREADAAREPTYVEKRLAAYPPVREQLDMIFHDFDAWRAAIAGIKARFPKA